MKLVIKMDEDLCNRLPDTLRATNGDIVLHDINGNCVGTARIS